MTLLEQETIITWNREEDEMEIYTFEPKMIRIFTKFADEHPDLCRHEEPRSELYAHIFTLNKALVSIHPKRVLTDEQREALRQRGRENVRRLQEIQPKQALEGHDYDEE